MATNTRIEWADATINPLVGCSKISPACDHCYAERMAARMVHNPAVAQRFAGTVDAHGKWTGKINLFPSEMKKALRWRKAQRIFVGSMSDLFHDDVPDEFLDTVFAYMLASHTLANCANHTFMLLTKRPDRMREYLSAAPSALIERWAKAGDGWIILDNEDVLFSEFIFSHASWELSNHGPKYAPWAYTEHLFPLPNVWLGTTVEDQARADERVPELLATPGALHFVSCEPLLGPVDLYRWLLIGWQCQGCKGFFRGRHRQICPDCGREGFWSGSHDFDGHGSHGLRGLGWVIDGGETGPGARPSHPNWFRSHRDQCAEAGVPYFFKSWGEWGTTRIDMSTGAPAWDVFHDFNHYCCKAPTRMTKGDKLICPDGHVPQYGCAEGKSYPMAIVSRVGKARSGRLLDGAEHNAIPAGRV